MTEGITWVYEDDSVEEAVMIMSNHHVRRLPVLDRNKRLVGIVPFGDPVGGRSAVGNLEALASYCWPATMTPGCANWHEMCRTSSDRVRLERSHPLRSWIHRARAQEESGSLSSRLRKEGQDLAGARHAGSS
jgi:hypothetical protein